MADDGQGLDADFRSACCFICTYSSGRSSSVAFALSDADEHVRVGHIAAITALEHARQTARQQRVPCLGHLNRRIKRQHLVDCSDTAAAAAAVAVVVASACDYALVHCKLADTHRQIRGLVAGGFARGKGQLDGQM